MSTIYLVRHGQSMANINIDAGGYDSPLTLEGREQARHIKLDVDLVICSPLRRTLETLYYSQIHGMTTFIEYNFRERQCERADLLLIKYSTTSNSAILFEELHNESETEYTERIYNAAKTLLSYSQKYNRIAVVCHGCVIQSLTGKRLNNAEVITITQDRLRSILDKKINLETSCCAHY